MRESAQLGRELRQRREINQLDLVDTYDASAGGYRVRRADGSVVVARSLSTGQPSGAIALGDVGAGSVLLMSVPR